MGFVIAVNLHSREKSSSHLWRVCSYITWTWKIWKWPGVQKSSLLSLAVPWTSPLGPESLAVQTNVCMGRELTTSQPVHPTVGLLEFGGILIFSWNLVCIFEALNQGVLIPFFRNITEKCCPHPPTWWGTEVFTWNLFLLYGLKNSYSFNQFYRDTSQISSELSFLWEFRPEILDLKEIFIVNILMVNFS